MKVLIIEDEPFAQNELKRLLAKTTFDIEIIECIDSVEDSIEWFNSNAAPDLVFLDIQLSDGQSFDIFKSVEISAPIIFTTAYDEYAIQAFKVNSIDYLLKPIDQQALETALQKLQNIKKQFTGAPSNINSGQLDKLLELAKTKTEYKSRFIARIGDQIKYIKADEIAWFRAEDNEVLLVSQSNHKYIVDYTLAQLEEYLDPKTFYRINRSYIIHINSIQKIYKYFNSRLKIDLIHQKDDVILVSRINVPKFLQWIEG